jgi:hypothetical protein
MTDNEMRAQRFADVLEYYADTDKYSNTIDVLADCMHWCLQEGVPFDNTLRVARDHFAIECAQVEHKEQHESPEGKRGKREEVAMQQTTLDEEIHPDLDPEITR